MSNAKLRFEVRLAEGFNKIWGVFDNSLNRFVRKEDGFGVPCRVAKEQNGAHVAEKLNAVHEAAEKLKRDQEFEASAPKKPANKKAPAPTAETKPAPMKRTPPKVVKAQTKVETTPAPVAANKTRRKKAA